MCIWAPRSNANPSFKSHRWTAVWFIPIIECAERTARYADVAVEELRKASIAEHVVLTPKVMLDSFRGKREYANTWLL